MGRMGLLTAAIIAMLLALGWLMYAKSISRISHPTVQEK